MTETGRKASDCSQVHGQHGRQNHETRRIISFQCLVARASPDHIQVMPKFKFWMPTVNLHYIHTLDVDLLNILTQLSIFMSRTLFEKHDFEAS